MGAFVLFTMQPRTIVYYEAEQSDFSWENSDRSIPHSNPQSNSISNSKLALLEQAFIEQLQHFVKIEFENHLDNIDIPKDNINVKIEVESKSSFPRSYELLVVTQDSDSFLEHQQENLFQVLTTNLNANTNFPKTAKEDFPHSDLKEYEEDNLGEMVVQIKFIRANKKLAGSISFKLKHTRSGILLQPLNHWEQQHQLEINVWLISAFQSKNILGKEFTGIVYQYLNDREISLLNYKLENISSSFPSSTISTADTNLLLNQRKLVEQYLNPEHFIRIVPTLKAGGTLSLIAPKYIDNPYDKHLLKLCKNAGSITRENNHYQTYNQKSNQKYSPNQEKNHQDRQADVVQDSLQPWTKQPSPLQTYYSLVQKQILSSFTGDFGEGFGEGLNGELWIQEKLNLQEKIVHFILGKRGAGKTHLLRNIARELKELGFACWLTTTAKHQHYPEDFKYVAPELLLMEIEALSGEELKQTVIFLDEIATFSTEFLREIFTSSGKFILAATSLDGVEGNALGMVNKLLNQLPDYWTSYTDKSLFDTDLSHADLESPLPQNPLIQDTYLQSTTPKTTSDKPIILKTQGLDLASQEYETYQIHLNLLNGNFRYLEDRLAQIIHELSGNLSYEQILEHSFTLLKDKLAKQNLQAKIKLFFCGISANGEISQKSPLSSNISTDSCIQDTSPRLTAWDRSSLEKPHSIDFQTNLRVKVIPHSDYQLTRELYQLSTLVHYRAGVGDFARMFTEDSIQYGFYLGDELIGGVQLFYEQLKDKDLAIQTLAGSRLPKGNLSLQQLLLQTGNLAQLLHLPTLRVSRIFLKSSYQGLGLAERFFALLEQQVHRDFQGEQRIRLWTVSYSYHPKIARFWQGIGFTPVAISKNLQKNSSLPTQLLVKPANLTSDFNNEINKNKESGENLESGTNQDFTKNKRDGENLEFAENKELKEFCEFQQEVYWFELALQSLVFRIKEEVPLTTQMQDSLDIFSAIWGDRWDKIPSTQQYSSLSQESSGLCPWDISGLFHQCLVQDYLKLKFTDFVELKSLLDDLKTKLAADTKDAQGTSPENSFIDYILKIIGEFSETASSIFAVGLLDQLDLTLSGYFAGTKPFIKVSNQLLLLGIVLLIKLGTDSDSYRDIGWESAYFSNTSLSTVEISLIQNLGWDKKFSGD